MPSHSGGEVGEVVAAGGGSFGVDSPGVVVSSGVGSAGVCTVSSGAEGVFDSEEQALNRRASVHNKTGFFFMESYPLYLFICRVLGCGFCVSTGGRDKLH